MKNIFLQLVFWFGLFFIMIGVGEVIKAEDNKTKDVWTTQLLYDTTNACYQGTVRWIMMANPALIGQTPPLVVQRQMVQHCFCILDKIRNEFPMGKYIELVESGLSVGELFMKKAYECIGEFDTMKGIIVLQDQLDNSTKIDNETEVIPTEPEGPEESMPDEQLEQQETIIQG
jgi:hypothetical protein